MKKTTKMMVAAVAVLWMGGCSVLDAIDGKLREIGALPSARLSSDVDQLAVVSIEAGGETGVGVVVADQTVFTAYHVVKSAGTVMVRFYGLYKTGYHKEVEGRVIYSNPSADQCLIHVETETPHVIPMGEATGGKAVVLGLSRGQANRFGQVVSYPSARACSIDGSTYAPEQSSKKGDSGSPIIQSGKVVGLVKGPSMMVSTRMSGRMYAMVAK